MTEQTDGQSERIAREDDEARDLDALDEGATDLDALEDIARTFDVVRLEPQTVFALIAELRQAREIIRTTRQTHPHVEVSLRADTASTEPESSARDVRRDFYLRTLQLNFSGFTAREKKRMWRKYPLIKISLEHLVNEGLIP